MSQMPRWIPIIISILLAVTPVIIWSKILFRKTAVEKKTIMWIFIGGTLSVIPILALQALWGLFPVLDIISLIETTFRNPKEAALFVFVVVGIMEEVVKHLVVRGTDKRHPELMQTVNNALVFSFVSALGFAFAENIFYFYNIFINLGLIDLFSSFVFRAIFTVCGHMIFSGIFGYYFGIAKFASDITAKERFSGKKFYLTRFFGRIFGWKTYKIYRQQKILQGLGLAILLHAVFNFLLESNKVIPVILLIITSAIYMYFLMHRKSAHLVFSFAARKRSEMNLKDEEVVIELLGMWEKENKYQEVSEICERLLERDPDNNVVKLFKAKAADNQKLRSFFNALKSIFKKTELKLTPAGELPPLTPENEKVIGEVLDMWFREGSYSKVVEIANRLLARNPKSEGAKVILKKAIDKEKLEKVFDSLKLLFE